MSTYFYIADGISYLFEVYIFSVFYKTVCRKPLLNRAVRLGIFIFAAAMLWMINFFVQNTWVNLIAVLAASYLLTLIYDIDLKMRLSGTLVMFVLMALCELIVGFILSAIFYATITEINENLIYYTVGIFASKAIMLFGVKLFSLRYKRNDIDIPNGLLAAFSVFPIATLIIGIILIGGFGKDTDPAFAVAGSAGTILLALANILVFYLFERYAKQNKARYQMQAEQSRLKAETIYLNNLIERQQNSNKQMHDLKNQLFAIRQIIAEDSDRGIEEIDKVCNVVNGMQSIVYSGDSSIDSLINSKTQNLPPNVKFFCECFIFDFGKTDRMDMCILLGNLLDNAVEAATPIENSFIKLKFLQQGNLLNITLSNSCNKDLQGNKFETTKADKTAHGYGLKSVRNIVDKYGGCIDIACKDGEFIVYIGFYLS